MSNLNISIIFNYNSAILFIKNYCNFVQNISIFSLIYSNLMQNKSKKQFNPKEHIKNGLTEEEIIRIKENFDVFDTQGRGWIDPKCIIFFIQKSSNF
jgi:hypothetical protein